MAGCARCARRPFPTSVYLVGKLGAALVHGLLISLAMAVLARDRGRRRPGLRAVGRLRGAHAGRASCCSARSGSRSPTSPGRRRPRRDRQRGLPAALVRLGVLRPAVRAAAGHGRHRAVPADVPLRPARLPGLPAGRRRRGLHRRGPAAGGAAPRLGGRCGGAPRGRPPCWPLGARRSPGEGDRPPARRGGRRRPRGRRRPWRVGATRQAARRRTARAARGPPNAGRTAPTASVARWPPSTPPPVPPDASAADGPPSAPPCPRPPPAVGRARVAVAARRRGGLGLRSRRRPARGRGGARRPADRPAADPDR